MVHILIYRYNGDVVKTGVDYSNDAYNISYYSDIRCIQMIKCVILILVVSQIVQNTPATKDGDSPCLHVSLLRHDCK